MRFQWVNGLPLIYSQWVQDNPKGVYMKGCVVWVYQLGGWFDIGWLWPFNGFHWLAMRMDNTNKHGYLRNFPP